MNSHDLIQKALLPVTMDYSSQVPENYGIRKALTMLHDVGVVGLPRVSVMSKPKGLWDPTVENAHVDRRQNDPVIYVNDVTSIFKNADKGKPDALAELASILAHENYHITHQPGELPAYDYQLDVLNKLRAPHKVVDRVQKARDYIAEVLGK